MKMFLLHALKVRSIGASALSALLTASPVLADTFHTGVIVPLTGPIAEYGVAIKNGIELAASDAPEMFSTCRFTFEDSAYNSHQALSALQKLKTSAKADLAYVFGGPTSEALAPAAESGKFPLITDSIDTNVARNRKYVLQYSNAARDYGLALVQTLQKRGIKKAVIISAENQYIEALLGGFAEAAKGQIEFSIIAKVNPDDTDLRSLIPRIRSTPHDAVGLFLMPGQLSSFAKNLSGNSKPLFGGDFLESPVELENAQGTLEGALYPNNIVTDSFRRRYRERYRNEAQLKFAAEGYDVAMLVAKELCPKHSKESLGADKIIELLTTSAPRDGAQGRTEFRVDANGARYFAAPVITMVASRNGFLPVP